MERTTMDKRPVRQLEPIEENSHESEELDSMPLDTLQLVFKQYKLLLKYFKTRETWLRCPKNYCKHEEETCMSYAWNGFKGTFKKAYLLKIVLAGILALLRHKLKIYKNLGFLISNDTIRFALFPSLFSFVYRITISILRRTRNKEDGFNPLAAAMLASFTIFMDNDRARRQKIALYTLIRALHSITEISDQNKIMKKIPNSEVLVFMLSVTAPIYLYFYERDILPKGTNNAFEPMSCVKPNMVLITDAWRRQAKYRYC